MGARLMSRRGLPATVIGLGIGAMLFLLRPAALDDERIPAFPGAEGFGAQARGGRGGDVLLVTSLEDYFVSFGASLEYDGGQTGGPPNGVFQHRGAPIGLRDISDGSSNTVACGEWKVGSGDPNVLTIPSDMIWMNSYPGGMTRNTASMALPAANRGNNLIAWLIACELASIPGPPGMPMTATRHPASDRFGMAWAFSLSASILGNLVLPPNPRYPACMTAPKNTQALPGTYGIASYHPGGANALFADGTVRFLKDSTSLPTIWALGSRSQGEILSPDAY